MDDTNPDDTDVSRPDHRPAGLATATVGPAVRRVSPGVAAVHGLWIGPPAVAVVLGLAILLAPAEDFASRLSSALFPSAFIAVVWSPAAAVWGCAAGALSGLAARLVDRPGPSAGRVVLPVLGAGAVGAGAGWAGTLVIDVPPYGGSAVVLVWGALTGAAAVAVERRGARRAAEDERPRTISGLAGATAVLTTVAWLWTGWVSLRAEPFWDVDETCGPLLGWPSDEIGFVGGGFPSRGWCIAGASTAVPTQPAWQAVVATALVTAAVMAGSALLARRLGAWRTPAGRVTASGVLVVLLGAGVAWAWATATAEPSDADRQRAVHQRGAAVYDYGVESLPESEPKPSTPPVTVPAVSGAAARADLEALRAAAQDAGGPELLWPEPLAVVDAPCTATDGTAGVLPSLTGRFTTRDLATAVDNVDFLSITQDNEDVAERIVQAWSRNELGTPEPLHGEWWQGPTPDGQTTVEIAHVGFEEGVGDVRVDAVCTTLP